MWKFLAGLAVVYFAWRLWQGRTRPPGTPIPPPVPPMDPEEAEARALLGVSRDADAKEIGAAHRKLIADVHPDRGGSGELARRANAARDRLLKR